MTNLRWAIADGWEITRRNLLHYIRMPQMIVFSSIQPIMFILLFRYVLGGSIHIPGYSYANYLLPGIFIQTATFGTMNTAMGLAEDMQTGIIERFRSLPMARSAVLVGRTTADLIRNVFVVTIMTLVGLAVGFRPNSISGFFGGALLILLFSYAISWVFALVGLAAKNAESAQAMVFPLIFPLTFASSAFAPVATMPSALQVFVRNQPFTAIINAVRQVMVGGPLHGSLTTALIWIVGIVVVFAPLAVKRYKAAV